MDSNLNIFSKRVMLFDNVMIRSILNIEHDPILIMLLIPYMALICNSYYEYIELNKKYNEIFQEIIDIRHSVKFEPQKYSKLRKKILNVDDLSHRQFQGKLKIFGRVLFPYKNLGIYSNEDEKIISTTNLVWFCEGNYSDKSNKDYYLKLGEKFGSLLMLMYHAITPDDVPLYNIANFKQKFYGTDINTFSSHCFKNGHDRDINIALLNIQGLINFPRYILKDIIGDMNFLYFKLRFISSYYAYITLNNIYNYSNMKKVINENNMKELKILINEHNLIQYSNLRKSLMHYDLEKTKGIEYSKLNLSLPDFGYINAHGFQVDYKSFIHHLNLFGNAVENFAKAIIDVPNKGRFLLSK